MASNLSGVTTFSGVGLHSDNLEDISKAVNRFDDSTVPQMKPQTGEQTSFDESGAPLPAENMYDKVTKTTELFDNHLAEQVSDNEDKWGDIQHIKEAGAILKATGGVINAQSKYSQIVNQNNFNIHMAEIQEAQITSSSAFAELREQTKGKSRGDNERLGAVAQGQSANGDLANTQASNEEVYAAQNMMNMKINSMRQIFGLQSQERMLQSQNRMAAISRDAETVHAILGGVEGIMGAKYGKTGGNPATSAETGYDGLSVERDGVDYNQ